MKVSKGVLSLLSSLLLITFASGAAHAEENLTINTGKAKMGALLQGWAVNDTTIQGNNANSNFRMRRAEFRLSGSVRQDTRFFLMMDAAKNLSATGDNKVLQDFGVGFTPVEHFEIVIGQFKIPTLAEGFNSSAELLLPERSYVGRNYADRRESGVMLDYNLNPIRVRVMASNGQARPADPLNPTPVSGSAGTNVDDTDSSKDFHGRVDFAINENFKLGVFGSNSVSTLGHSTRYGGDLEFLMDRWLARLGGVGADELDVDKNGMALDVAYRINDPLQAVVRYENYQRTTAVKGSASAYTVGLNYYLEGNNLKLQLAHTFMNNMSSTSGTAPATSASGSYSPVADTDGSLTILSVQTML
jgi:hypothetical protein